MTAHGEVVRSYEPEEMEPTKKQRFCALVHGSARLDDHAIIGDVIHEREPSKGGCVSERTNCGWVHSLLGEHEDQTQTRHSRCVPLSYAKKGGCDMVLFTLPCLGTGAERI